MIVIIVEARVTKALKSISRNFEVGLLSLRSQAVRLTRHLLDRPRHGPQFGRVIRASLDGERLIFCQTSLSSCVCAKFLAYHFFTQVIISYLIVCVDN